METGFAYSYIIITFPDEGSIESCKAISSPYSKLTEPGSMISRNSAADMYFFPILVANRDVLESPRHQAIDGLVVFGKPDSPTPLLLEAGPFRKKSFTLSRTFSASFLITGSTSIINWK